MPRGGERGQRGPRPVTPSSILSSSSTMKGWSWLTMQAGGVGLGRELLPHQASQLPPPAATPGSPDAPPASIPGQQPQLSHQSPRVDREDSGMTCFHCFLSQERGWRQRAGDPVFLLPAGTWDGAPFSWGCASTIVPRRFGTR